MARAGRPCTREELLADVWQMDFDPHTNVVDVCVHRVTRQGRPPASIRTVRNLGYVLDSERRGEIAWGAFCVACAVAMLLFPQWQTVPFHWIWITITFLYGFRRWTNPQTAGVAARGRRGHDGIAMLRTPVERAELSEIPLMTCVFLGMVWHVRRRQEAVDEQRRAAERERGFMRDAAHSLRTPLTVAQGHAEFVRDGLEAGTQSHDDATVLLDELRRLARISDQLLMLGAAGHTEALLLAPVALDRLAGEAARRWSAASGRAVAVDAPAPVAVLADEQRLRHALDALVENALNATGAGRPRHDHRARARTDAPCWPSPTRARASRPTTSTGSSSASSAAAAPRVARAPGSACRSCRRSPGPRRAHRGREPPGRRSNIHDDPRRGAAGRADRPGPGLRRPRGARRLRLTRRLRAAPARDARLPPGGGTRRPRDGRCPAADRPARPPACPPDGPPRGARSRAKPRRLRLYGRDPPRAVQPQSAPKWILGSSNARSALQ